MRDQNLMMGHEQLDCMDVLRQPTHLLSLGLAVYASMDITAGIHLRKSAMLWHILLVVKHTFW